MADAKIICLDLETLPDMKKAMTVFPQLSQYPGLTLKASINSIICVGWKVFGESKVNCINAWDYARWNEDINDDYLVVRDAYEVLKDADAVVTHNGKRFDWKFFQTRLLIHKFPPLPKIKHVDTCAIGKANLFFFNNKLNTLAQALTETEKMEHDGWPMWVAVSERDIIAQANMTRYCMQDVVALEELFKVLRPFATNLPNQNLHKIAEVRNLCPSCGSSRLESFGAAGTSTHIYRRYSCVDCKSYCRTDKEDRNPRAI